MRPTYGDIFSREFYMDKKLTSDFLNKEKLNSDRHFVFSYQ